MFSYISLMILVVAFLLVIVLHAVFTRRMLALRDRALAAKSEYQKLRAKVSALAEEVNEMRQGVESNGAAAKNIEAAIEAKKQQIADYDPEEETAY